MLEPAIKYKEQLQMIQYDSWFNDKYKYWNADPHYCEIKLNTDTWNKHQFVSVYQNKPIGYISYSIDRRIDAVTGFSAINFSNHTATFGMDLGQAIKDIFEKYGFNKLNFSVVIGNPIEKTYDKMIKRYGGRVVGVYEDDVKLHDGKLYDLKIYEITKKKYFSNARSE